MNFITCTSQIVPCPAGQQQLVSLAELVAEAVSQIDPASIAQAYAFGAGSVVTWWGLGFAVASAAKALSKA